MADRDQVEEAVLSASLAVQAALAEVDRLFLEFDTSLPRRAMTRLTHARGQAAYLLTVLNSVMVDVDAEEERVARRSSERTGPGAKPAWGEFEEMMTKRLIGSGALPADATPLDFMALQARQRERMASMPAPGTVALPSVLPHERSGRPAWPTGDGEDHGG